MATLIVIEGPAEGEKFDLGNARLVMVGRDETSTFQVRDPRISRYHLQIEWQDDAKRHVAHDFNSANGVFVNGTRIAAETPLNDGDTIQIGDTALRYTLEDVPDSQTFSRQLRQHRADETRLR